MRIAIDYRFVSGGPNVVNRGTGRYTQQQLREVLRRDTQNEYLLICHADADEGLILPEIRSAPNVILARLTLPGLRREHFPNSPSVVMHNVARFQDWLYAQRVDLFHETTPYQIDELVLSHFDLCPMVVTLYDLIPMVYPDYYWPWDSPYHADLERALQLMARASRLIAISEATRQDGHKYLGMPLDRIELAYPAVDPFFQIRPIPEVRQVLAPLRARLKIPERFVLSVTHIHHSKNLETLFAAYAQLPDAMREECPLVVVFYLRDEDRMQLQEWLTYYGIERDVILTGLVSDNELRALLNAATVVAHPSRYEGFGYPVIEAMQCGAPVITTTSSSLPEVGGTAARLVDPDDVVGLTEALSRTLSDPALRDHMRALGQQQIRRFDPEQLGRSTLASYELARAAPLPPANRPRLAMWTSLPPLHCGIADYTVELLESLRDRYDIELFVDSGYLPRADLMRDYVLHHYTEFERRQAQRPFDVIVYQLGISFMHDYMYRPLKRYPGIVVLHDLNFASNLYFVYRERRQLDVFEREIVAPEGAAAVAKFRRVQQLRGAQRERAMTSFLETYHLNRWIVDYSRAQIVHMDEAKRELEARCPDARAFTVLQGVQDPLTDVTRRLRPRRGELLSDPEEFVVGLFGTVAPIKRVEVCLQAFAQLVAAHPRSRLVIVGEHVDGAYVMSLQKLVQTLGLAAKVQFLGRTSLDEFFDWLLAVDVVLNLRYPPKLQMSAVLCRAIAAGKPLVVTDLPEWRFLPESFCCRVAVDDQEVTTIAAHLRWLAEAPAIREQRARSAREFYETSGTIAYMAARYEAVVSEVTGQAPAPAPADPPHPPLELNKVCAVEDFDDPELAGLIAEVYPHEAHYFSVGFPHNKLQARFWQSGLALKALRCYEVLNGRSQILTIGAHAHPLNYYLTRHAARIVATDDYLGQDGLGLAMWAAPDAFAPFASRLDRLNVRHVDLRHLPYDTGTFEAVVACRALRVPGGLAGVAQAAYELGRVLRAGGVASLQVDLALASPPGEAGWQDGLPLLSAEQVQRYLVEASGLELVGPLQLTPSRRTLALPRDLTQHPDDYDVAHDRPRQIIQTIGGYAVIPLHLVLRKTAAYPAQSNDWARPSADVLRVIQQRIVAAAFARSRPDSLPKITRPRHPPPAPAPPLPAPLLQFMRRWVSERTVQRIRAVYRGSLALLPTPLAARMSAVAVRLGLVERP
jgi:glycosyltransferase involved in cell wall biosynthesis